MSHTHAHVEDNDSIVVSSEAWNVCAYVWQRIALMLFSLCQKAMPALVLDYLSIHATLLSYRIFPAFWFTYDIIGAKWNAV